jgi:hypothetical protein
MTNESFDIITEIKYADRITGDIVEYAKGMDPTGKIHYFLLEPMGTKTRWTELNEYAYEKNKFDMKDLFMIVPNEINHVKTL